MAWRVVQKRRRQSGGIAMQIQIRADQNGGSGTGNWWNVDQVALSIKCSKQTGKQRQTNKIRKITHRLGASRKSTLTPFPPLRAYSMLRGIRLPSGMPHISCERSLVNWTAFKTIFNWKGRMFPSNSKCTSKEPHGKNNPGFKEAGPAWSSHCLCVSFPWNKGILWL